MDDSEKITLLQSDVELLKQRYKELKDNIEPIKQDSIRADEKFKQIILTLNEVKEDVKILKDRPSKFFDYIIMAVMSAVIAYVFTHFGV